MDSGYFIGDIVPSEVDGPSVRAVIHFAGCSVGCAGCFNPNTHDRLADGVWRDSAQSIASRMLAISDHVTISGGEPTDQIGPLKELLTELRRQGTESVILFTGRRVEWLRENREGWSGIEDSGLVDVVIDGPFMQNRIEQGPYLRGSSNQRILMYTDRYTQEDLLGRDVQVLIQNGKIVITGFPDDELMDMLRSMAA